MFKKKRHTKAEARKERMKIRNRKHLFLIIKNILLFLLLVILITTITIGYEGYELYKNAITEISVEEKIKEIKNSDNYITLDKISEDYKNAVIAVEDHRFYNHLGFDPFATIKAAFNNIKTKSLGQGGSTITQQLSKNMYFSQKKEFARKIAELFVSFELEKKLSKEEILELYINIIYFGDGYYGISEASLGYYDKTPENLNLDESMMLAGLPAAPSVYSPTVNEDLANQRLNQVKSAMFKYGYLKSEG